ncbi:MAG: response regulator [Candidatus Falkowbacteria bacterium]|nr:MAG: response regulator [Candidatus Falkowbacteria bacterium]
MIKTNAEKTILVIEDERPLLDAIRTKLEKNDFLVVTARTAEQTYGLLEDLKQVDVIWLDHYLLGKENGLDIVTKLKGHEKYKKIPIFIVSNTASADKVKNYISLGVNKYYIKSNYRLDQIIGDIRDCLK